VRSAANAVDSIKITTGSGTIQANRISADTLVPFELMLVGKTSDAIDGYRKIKKEKPGHVTVSEDRLNALGYALLRQKKLPESIALFKLNVEFYPNAWNVYDSLAEAYMTNGDKDLAIANYKKSLEINPANSNAAEMLKKLEAPTSKQPDQPKKAQVHPQITETTETGAGAARRSRSQEAAVGTNNSSFLLLPAAPAPVSVVCGCLSQLPQSFDWLSQ
jgi:tetratricopeptide (TPR) repeat protein